MAKALAELRVVELEFVKATIARTTEELEILQSQKTAAESRITSSAEDLVRVAESYIAASFSESPPPHDILIELEKNVALTTIFFKDYLYPSVAPDPDSPKSAHSTLHPPSSAVENSEFDFKEAGADTTL